MHEQNTGGGVIVPRCSMRTTFVTGSLNPTLIDFDMPFSNFRFVFKPIIIIPKSLTQQISIPRFVFLTVLEEFNDKNHFKLIDDSFNNLYREKNSVHYCN